MKALRHSSFLAFVFSQPGHQHPNPLPASNPNCDGNIKEHSFLFQLSALTPMLVCFVLFFLPLDI